MATAKETMATIEKQLAGIRLQIEHLRIEEAAIIRLIETLSGQPAISAPRRRIPNVKQFVLQIMESFGASGAASTEVYQIAKKRHSDISRDTVSSVLSRLKAAEALTYDGERYYDARFTRERVADLLSNVTKNLKVSI